MFTSILFIIGKRERTPKRGPVIPMVLPIDYKIALKWCYRSVMNNLKNHKNQITEKCS